MDVIDTAAPTCAGRYPITAGAPSCFRPSLLADEHNAQFLHIYAYVPRFMYCYSGRLRFPRLLVVVIFLLSMLAVFDYAMHSSSTVRTHSKQIASCGRLQSSGAHAITVHFMTLNTFIRPIGVGTADFKDERLDDLAHVLRSFDVICFQELFNWSGYRKVKFLQQLAKHYGFIYHTTTPSPGFRGLFSYPPKLIDGGLVIASRFQILRTDYQIYSRANFHSIDFIVAKGALYAQIAVPMPNSSSCAVNVFTTHMQASNGLSVDFSATRHAQLEQLLHFVRQKTQPDPSVPIILAGDFNVNGRRACDDSSSSHEYEQMMSVLRKIRQFSPLQDILYEASGHEHPVTGAGGLYGDTQKNERLDYIFFSPGARRRATSGCNVTTIPASVRVQPLRVSQRPYRTLSDHYAVVSNFRFEQTTNLGHRPCGVALLV